MISSFALLFILSQWSIGRCFIITLLFVNPHMSTVAFADINVFSQVYVSKYSILL